MRGGGRGRVPGVGGSGGCCSGARGPRLLLLFAAVVMVIIVLVGLSGGGGGRCTAASDAGCVAGSGGGRATMFVGLERFLRQPQSAKKSTARSRKRARRDDDGGDDGGDDDDGDDGGDGASRTRANDGAADTAADAGGGNADSNAGDNGFVRGYPTAPEAFVNGRRVTSSVYYGSTASATSPPPYAAKRRLIFTISTGHTGTMWLVRVLRCSDTPITANHEAKPSLVSFHLVLLQGLARTYEVRKGEKLGVTIEALLNATEAAGGGSAYADISHMFIKSWQDLIMDWLAANDPRGERYIVDIVVLRRYLPYVLRSYLTDRFSWRPELDLTTWSGGEYTVFHRNMAVLPPMYEHGALDSVDEIMGYLVDMELQYHIFRRKYPQWNYYEFRSEELFSRGGPPHLLQLMHLTPTKPTCMLVLSNSRSVNPHVDWRLPDLYNVSEAFFLARARAYIDRYRAAGYPLPPFPQMRTVSPCGSPAAPELWCEERELRFTDAELAAWAAKADVPNNKPALKAKVPIFKQYRPEESPRLVAQ